MLIKTISNEVTQTVTLGGGAYAAHLTVTATGKVQPNVYAATGIYAALASARLLNLGSIYGGYGGYRGQAGTAGIGVDFANGGKLINQGFIHGGYGSHEGDTGGIGVSLSGGTASNSGTISGGEGGYYGGTGGAAIVLTHSKLSNTGHVLGGAGGYGYAGGGGAGGIGILLESGTIVNQGAITGGGGGFSARAGGGRASGAGIDLAGTGMLKNDGTITGGTGFSYGENGCYIPGGDGVDIAAAATVINIGVVRGGNAPQSVGTYGALGAAGGKGVHVALNGTLTNSGTIQGGTGGNAFSGSYDYGGAGGGGVELTKGGKLTNTGIVLGGNGGYGAAGSYPENFPGGGAGGVGVYIGPGSTLLNSGTITAGNGGACANNTGGAGGAGVYLNGGTLTTAGTITGGLGGAGKVTDGANGDAVQFGSLAATMVITADAVFNGAVVADSAVDDALVLAGRPEGVLNNFGTNITGFTNIDEDPGAHWRLNGSVSGTGALTVGIGAILILDGAVSISSVVFAQGGGETLRVEKLDQFSSVLSGFGASDVIDLPAIKATSFTFAHDTLTLLDANNTSLGTLSFAGKYSKADFALQKDAKGNTEVVYVGAHQAYPPPDFLSATALLPRMDDPVYAANPMHSGSSMIDRPLFDMPQLWHAHIASGSW